MGNFIFNLAGLAVGLNCQEPDQRDLIWELWNRLYVLENGVSLPPNLQYLFKIPGQVIETNSEGAEVISESLYLSVLRRKFEYTLRSGSSTLIVDVENGKCIGVLNEDFWGQPLEHQREYFLLSFLMLLQPKRRYGLHANVIVNDDVGYVIAGPAGSGKTTLTLGIVAALVKRGLSVQCFKCGPDFIDPTLHRAITSKNSYNLDLKMMGLQKQSLVPEQRLFHYSFSFIG